jgi:hypothetical protein
VGRVLAIKKQLIKSRIKNSIKKIKPLAAQVV